MESPALSRSPSATFAPSARGRRSHTNVHHLSLAPLTPKYPIDPADYDAYFDPSTSALHTSTSLSQIAVLPSPGGILTQSPARSRANSKARLKRPKSRVSIRAPEDIPSGAVTSEGYGHKKDLRVQAEWLVHTGLALTEGSRESKGQSWITKRDSSTSLHTPDDQIRSGRATPRSRSRRRSKKDLKMTPAAITPVHDVQPDWADSHTQEEIAAQIDNALDDEYEDDDQYGALNFEGNFSDDEEEVRQAISRYRLGQWMDNVVDVMLKLEDDVPEIEKDDDHQVDVEPPPIKPKGMWDDVAWFGRLLARTVRS